MTAKDKAKAIMDKYRTYVVMWTGGVSVENENVKQCALIAVDEIIDAIKVYHNGAEWVLHESMGWKFWQSVKKEINAL